MQVVSIYSVDFKQHFPKAGWVEHEPTEIWSSVVESVNQVLKSAGDESTAKKITAIGITNQRETVCFWDRRTSEPLGRAIVWQDRRTAEFCNVLKKKGLEEYFQKNTGLLLDPYFSGTKVHWALKNQSETARAMREGRLAVGTVDSFLISRFSGGKVHVTEPSNASRTLCFHLLKHRWDSELCSHLEIPREIWPEVKPSIGIFAKTKDFPGLPDGIPISGVLGDQQSALLGQACIQEGNAKCTYGTGAFLLLNTGQTPVESRHRLLTTVAWAQSPEDYTYALEGSTFVAGAAVQWLRDGLGIIHDSSEIEKLALSVDSSLGTVFVPALTGLGAPHWNPQATGLITGITRGTTRAHIARATLEGIAFQNVDLLQAMEKDLGKPIVSLNVDGGAAANNLLMQLQSDFLGIKLKRPRFLESTSLGAVFAAGLGVRFWKNLNEIEKTWKMDREFSPQISLEKRKEELEKWSRALGRVL